ncbi:MAG: hypothetical protein ABTQ32_01080, partial [Myxococcaceae bacterium]
MLTMLLPLALAATDISVEVAAGVECVGQQGVVARLERAGVSVVRSSTRLHVTITGTGALIRVRGVRAGTPLERDITVSAGDCGAVERVISALIQSWSQAIPRASEATSRRDSDAGTALVERASNEPQRDDGAGARAANEADAGVVVRRTLMPVDTRRDARDEPDR